MFIYKNVKIDSKEALKLQIEGWKMVLTDVYNGYILFEKQKRRII